MYVVVRDGTERVLRVPPRPRSGRGDRAPYLRRERRRIDRGIAIEGRLDEAEELERAPRFDQARREHGAHVLQIMVEPALDLRQCL
jgi:hypothetical protein